MRIFRTIGTWFRVEVIWRTTRQTSIWAFAWDGYWPFTGPQTFHGTPVPHKPLYLPRCVHWMIQHIVPSTALALLSVWLGLPGSWACLVGMLAFGAVPHIVGVWVTRSYPLDPRDCVSDLLSSSFPWWWLPSLMHHSALGILPTVLLVGTGASIWLAGMLSYVCAWASP